MKKSNNLYATLKCLRFDNNFLYDSFSIRPVPLAFDPDEILSLEFPEGYGDLERDKIVFIVSAFYTVPARDKGAIKWENFINVYPYIIRLVPDCVGYLDMLVRHNVLFSSEQWHFGRCPKHGFAFTEEYEAPGFKVEYLRVTEFIDQIMLNEFKRLNGMNLYPQLSNFYINGKLTIDFDAYHEYLANGWDPRASEVSFMDRGANLNILALNTKLFKAFDLNTHRYLFSLDPKTRLVSTTLMDLPKDARQFVRYAGNYLSEVKVCELTNVVFTALLDAGKWGFDDEFYVYLKALANKKRGGKTRTVQGIPLLSGMHSKLSFNEYRLLYSHSIAKAKSSKLKKPKNNLMNVGSLQLDGNESLLALLYDTSLTPNIARSLIKLFNKKINGEEYMEVTKFRNVVSKGGLFNCLFDALRVLSPESSNVQVRESLGHVIYGKGYKSTQQLAMIKAFKGVFPTIHTFVKLLNKMTNGNCVGLLEQMEGKFILDSICHRINNKASNLPLSPLRHGVVTTGGNEDYVALMIREEVQTSFELPCSIKVIPWGPAKPKDSYAMAA
ncbi:hypothetical protein [Rufibacter latericius]|uniref:Uncharacterized protein n=1 Tax=Rufibacter latericius TaxID=2487040 RepID=A0A3M9MBQ7_9BACT|nr:hypothetical protein [Rufibacter latericius]RNI22605.1 hypothetical protein EFB08_21150 [Rufibacter latericius]